MQAGGKQMSSSNRPTNQQALSLELGPRLRKLRKSRGYTLEQAATLYGMRFPGLCNIERNKDLPSIERLVRIARVYGVSEYELYRLWRSDQERRWEIEQFERLQRADAEFQKQIGQEPPKQPMPPVAQPRLPLPE
jgi:transcriptional regulator with XRE-family HTH domain